MGNMWCGYASIVYSLRGEYEIAAPFIGIAYALDALDGRIARMTGTESDFGVQLDSLADVISFGIAPAVLSYAWGLQSFGRLGWAVGFMFVACAAMRLARFNVQSASGADKRYYEPGELGVEKFHGHVVLAVDKPFNGYPLDMLIETRGKE